MTIETRIEALKVKLAEKFSDDRTNFIQRHAERVMWRDAHKSTFTAGASALAEVFLLRGKILGASLDAVGVMEAEEKLEALLKQMEEKV